jgi:Flp pilus assembly protein TadD
MALASAYMDTTTLLVNTNQAQRKVHAALLKDIGYNNILVSSTGDEAWSIVKNMTVDLIISAWFLMPDLSGLGLLRVIRADAEKSNIPFMLMVEEITKTQVVEAGQAGVNEIIILPFNKETFKKKVDTTLKGDDDPALAETRVLIDEGVTLLKKGKLESALSKFQKILAINESAEVYYNLGYIRSAQGRYEEAIMAFRKATQLNQYFAQAFQKMGEVYAKMGRSDEARRCLERAAEIFMDRKMDAKAEKTFMRILEINPNTPNVFNSMGIVYRRQGKLEESIKMYIRALKVNPYDEHIHYNLARVYVGAKKYREAADVLKKALHINPDFIEGANLLRTIENGLSSG